MPEAAPEQARRAATTAESRVATAATTTVGATEAETAGAAGSAGETAVVVVGAAADGVAEMVAAEEAAVDPSRTRPRWSHLSTRPVAPGS